MPRITDIPARYDDAFAASHGEFRISRAEEAVTADMPDPEVMQRATEMLVSTLFDALRDTRLEGLADRIAWGIVHSFHKVADQLEGDADRAARQLRDLIRENDGGEIATAELEGAQLLCHSLDEAQGAVACMRDHGADIYHVETGRPWSAPRATLVSGKRTASVIDATDFLAARRQRRQEARAPEGPVVIFSGGKVWQDHRVIWDRLDEIRARVPAMLLATTGQERGCDAAAAAWAARTGTRLVRFGLDRSLGSRAGFARNEQLIGLRPVEALVCEGSGLQSHLARAVRKAGIPASFLTLAQQQA